MKAAKPKIGVRSQESGARRKEEEGRSQKKCFYKYEMLPYTPYYIKLSKILVLSRYTQNKEVKM
ncbi:hypothetical protein [Microcoleus sp. AT9b-C5]|uniref:hypothetical protein n=1 Tax=unclassified Microcoleus TaxID=2642155 RepID=UPI002FD54ADE